MINRRAFLVAAALAALPSSGAMAADAPMNVVASFSILGDMTARIGGERVRVSTLVGADADAHVYQPTPNDARTLTGAKLVVINGLGFEGWIDRLIAASGYKGPMVTATAGIKPLASEDHDDHDDHKHDDHKHDDHGHDHGEHDPHAWQSVANARQYVRNIAAGLAKADPDGAEHYRANAARYMAELDALDAEIRAAVDALPPTRRRVVTTHDAFAYFAADYGIEFLAPVGATTDAEPSAADVAALIRQIREAEIPAVFLENISDARLLERIAAETGAKIGGTLYSDALSGGGGPASSYIDMMRHNTRTLAAALGE